MRILIYILPILIITACKEKVELDNNSNCDPKSLGHLSLTMDDGRFVAGDTIVINGNFQTPIEAQLQFLITYSLGEYIDEVYVTGLEFQYELPRLISEKSGSVFITVFNEYCMIGTMSFRIAPGHVYNKIDSYSGPATIESSGIDWNLVTGIAKDKYDNPCADGTEMNYTIKYPNGRIRQRKEEMLMLLSGVRIDPTRKSGKIFTGIQSEQAHSVEREVLVTPTWPERFTIEVLDFLPYAEQRQLLKLRTSIIKDRFNNTVSDGTVIWFLTEDAEGNINRYRSFVVNGRSNVQIENPEYATRWKISAQVENSISSYPIYLSFSNTAKDIPIKYDQLGQTALIGPITGPLGQFIPNGVLVTLRLMSEEGTLITEVDKEILFGYYKWKLPENLMDEGRYTLTAFIGASEEQLELDYTPLIFNDRKSED